METRPGEVRLDADTRAFVAGARVARLATVGPDGGPHVLPFCFVLLGDRLYSVVDDKPKPSRTRLGRLRNLAAEPRAAVVVDHYSEAWGELRYVLLRGRAALVDDEAEYVTALAALTSKYEQYLRMTMSFATHPMIRLSIDAVHAWSADPRSL